MEIPKRSYRIFFSIFIRMKIIIIILLTDYISYYKIKLKINLNVNMLRRYIYIYV